MLSKQLAERPTLNQVQTYTREPSYIHHEAYEDKLAILVCQIKIWQPKGNDWYTVPANHLTIRECESIEIPSSTKDLLSKATVKFPRGTVISLSSNTEAEVTTGNESDNTTNTDTLSASTNNGDVITPRTEQTGTDNTPATSMAVRYDDKGLIDFNRTKDEPALLSPNDVATGNRIEIRLGYAYSSTEFDEMNTTEDHTSLDMVFTGFITSISVNTPLELECTNMAHVLTTMSVPNIPIKNTLMVKDFLDEGSTYDLLKDTGISLLDACKGSEISVRGGSLTENNTVADVLTSWEKSNILCTMIYDQSGKAYLKVGYAYYVGNSNNSDDLLLNDSQYITYNGNDKTVTLIQFDWDVAQDKLSLVNVDKKYLAVEAQGWVDLKQSFKLTVRKLPDQEDEGWAVDNGQFQTVNRHEVKDLKKSKVKDGVYTTKSVKSALSNPADLSKYKVVPYMSIKIGITEEELTLEAQQYYNSYNQNGISGSIEIFGDLYIQPGDIVGLIDTRQPEKNGYYYVDTVNISFGMGGYRRELKMPYRISSFTKTPEII